MHTLKTFATLLSFLLGVPESTPGENKLTSTQSRWAYHDDVPSPLPEEDFLAVVKNATVETTIWALDLHKKRELLESIRARREENDFDKHEEDKRTRQGIRGTTGTKMWFLHKDATGWKKTHAYGEFADPERGRCDVMFEDDIMRIFLPKSPPYIFIRLTGFYESRLQATQTIVSRYIDDEFVEYSAYEWRDVKNIVLKLTALPFNSSLQVDTFLQHALKDETTDYFADSVEGKTAGVVLPEWSEAENNPLLQKLGTAQHSEEDAEDAIGSEQPEEDQQTEDEEWTEERQAEYYAMLKKVVRETEIRKLTVGRRNSIHIAFYQLLTQNGITLEAETKRVQRGIVGTTGTLKWTLARRAQGWQVVSHSGAFAKYFKGQCNVTFLEGNMGLTLPESPPYLYLRVQLANPQGVTAEELFPTVVSRWTLSKHTDGLLYRLFNATDAEVSLTALPFNTSGQVENFLQFAALEDSVQIPRLEEERYTYLRHATDNPSPLESKQDAQKPAASSRTDYIKQWLYRTSIFGVPAALTAVFLFVYGGILFELFKRWMQNVCWKAATVVKGVLYRVNRAIRAGELDRQLQETKNALDQMIDGRRKLDCENVRLNEKVSNGVAELTRLRPLEGQLNYAKEQADSYLRDVERYRSEMRDARDEVTNIRTALTGAWAENDDLKRNIDQLTTSLGSIASENRQLHDELEAERSKNIKLSEQIRASQDSDSVRAGPSRPSRLRDEEAFKTFQIQVYGALWACHDRCDSIEKLMCDLREDGIPNAEEVARNLGYNSLRDFLHSPEMAAMVFVDNGPNGIPVYKAIPNETNAHLREQDQISAESHAEQIRKLRRLLEAEKRRAASLRRAIDEKTAEIGNLRDEWLCPLCMFEPVAATFLCGLANGSKTVCGHLACGACAEKWCLRKQGCHVCRQQIAECVRLYHS